LRRSSERGGRDRTPPEVVIVPGDRAGEYLLESICHDIKAGLAE